VVHRQADLVYAAQEFVTILLREIAVLGSKDNGEAHVDGDSMAVAKRESRSKLEGR
jgi:hypothetical protein